MRLSKRCGSGLQGRQATACGSGAGLEQQQQQQLWAVPQPQASMFTTQEDSESSELTKAHDVHVGAGVPPREGVAGRGRRDDGRVVRLEP